MNGKYNPLSFSLSYSVAGNALHKGDTVHSSTHTLTHIHTRRSLVWLLVTFAAFDGESISTVESKIGQGDKMEFRLNSHAHHTTAYASITYLPVEKKREMNKKKKDSSLTLSD